MGRIGLPELTIITTMAVFALVPMFVGVWAIVMIFQIRRDQVTMRDTLARIEQSLRK